MTGLADFIYESKSTGLTFTSRQYIVKEAHIDLRNSRRRAEAMGFTMPNDFTLRRVVERFNHE
jgi:hypothetical protein